MQAVVEAVFRGKKLCTQGGHFAGLFEAGHCQAAYLATGAKGLGPVTAQQHADDVRVFGPRIQAIAQGQDHRQGQGVEGCFSIKAGDADAGAVAAGELFEVQVHCDLIREGEGSV
jgi:hypothetical protein